MIKPFGRATRFTVTWLVTRSQVFFISFEINKIQAKGEAKAKSKDEVKAKVAAQRLFAYSSAAAMSFAVACGA